jgi:hypothetical protein
MPYELCYVSVNYINIKIDFPGSPGLRLIQCSYFRLDLFVGLLYLFGERIVYLVRLYAAASFDRLNPCYMHHVQKDLLVVRISQFDKNIFHFRYCFKVFYCKVAVLISCQYPDFFLCKCSVIYSQFIKKTVVMIVASCTKSRIVANNDSLW